jgi:hypothetical protein
MKRKTNVVFHVFFIISPGCLEKILRKKRFIITQSCGVIAWREKMVVTSKTWRLNLFILEKEVFMQ